ncbi:MAG: carboxypeptidase-like regulatory domain-containing protein, partial [Saprospiraceae bacterium]|nr:carboxypeptidase-like regulatory domain-containing protein [Saprospiraceae bacterium]
MRFIYIIFISIISSLSSAQSIKGVIKDNAGNPIDFAMITINASTEHVHSDQFGRYTLNAVAKGDSLVITHIFFETQTIIIDDTNNNSIVTILQNKNFDLNEVTITPDVQATKTISNIDLETNPVNNSQELLRRVPGLIIGQHAGGGKAEQIFLRGFDIDHGTDINLSVDGLPINLVTHAHGQGYADMHFIIPEII